MTEEVGLRSRIRRLRAFFRGSMELARPIWGKLPLVFLGQVSAAVGTLVCVRMLTELVDPSIYGTYRLLLGSTTLAAAVLARPFIQFAMRALHTRDGTEESQRFIEYASRRFRLYILLLASGLVAAAILTAGSLAPELTVAAVLAVAVFALRSLTSFSEGLFVSQNAQGRATAIAVANAWSLPIIAVPLALLAPLTVTALLAVTAATHAAISAWLVLRMRPRALPNSGSPSVAGRHGKEAMRFALPLMAVGVLSWLFHEGDRFLILSYLDETQVGLYAAAYGLVSAPITMLWGMLAQVLYPVLFLRFAAGDPASRVRVARRLLALAGTVAGVGVLIVAGWSDDIARFGIGPAYRASATPLMPWIAVGYGFCVVGMAIEMVALAVKRTLPILFAYGWAVAVNLALNALWIPRSGIAGAAMATAGAMAVYAAALLLTMRSALFCASSSETSTETSQMLSCLKGGPR